MTRFDLKSEFLQQIADKVASVNLLRCGINNHCPNPLVPDGIIPYFSRKIRRKNKLKVLQKLKNKMANLYKVIDIQGKGFGCVATQDIPKGTLILAEKPQIVLALSGNLRENVCSAFFAMSKKNKRNI